MKKKNTIDIWDYVLIAVGILLLPVFLIGLIPLGIFVMRLGDKWQKSNKELDKKLDEIDNDTREEYAVPMDSLDEEKVARWVWQIFKQELVNYSYWDIKA